MSTPLVSVIMPVYKVEDYVARAIESMQAQTFSDFEFLIVDDGTPDRSGEICDGYAGKDARITVFHTANGGAPAARNLAMDKASGKYYYFMDSDDWAEPTMLEEMVAIAERDSAQLVVAGYYTDIYYSETEFYQELHGDRTASYAGREFFEIAYRLFDDNLLYTPWNKLWNRSFIEEKKLRYPKTYWDDFPFCVSCIHDIERVSVTDRRYYHFIKKRAESETAAYKADLYEKREWEDDMLRELYAHWGVTNEPSKEFLARRYIERFVGCIENLTSPKCALTGGEKKTKLKTMLAAPRVGEALRLARPRSAMMKLMLVPVRMKSVFLCLLEGRVITRVKTGNVKLFAKLKANR